MVAPFNPGRMTDVVQLLAPTTGEDPFGQHPGWAMQFACAAQVEPLRGREFFAAGASQSVASLRVTVHYRPEIKGTWRLRWMGALFELVADPIDPEATHERLELMCGGVAGVPVGGELP